MNNTNQAFSIGAACIPHTPAVGFAALALQTTTNGWCQLLPAGKFKATDGRPHDTNDGYWHIDEPTAQRLIADLKQRKNKTVIDYEHQTLLSEINGKAAPAAGWFKNAEWRSSGLWVQAEWTKRAQNYISDDEYAYLSAVFPYDPLTGKPLSLHSVALVNKPGLDGMQVVALSARVLPPNHTHLTNPTENHQENNMIIPSILIALELAEAATEQQVLAAIEALKKGQATPAQETAVDDLAALKATAPSVDPTQYAPVAVVAALQQQLTALSAKAHSNEADAMIAQSLKDGRLLPAMEHYARDLAGNSLAALKTFLEATPSIAALSHMQAGDKPAHQQAARLSDDEKTAARLTGRTDAEFLSLKNPAA